MTTYKASVPSPRIQTVQCQSCGYCVESADDALPTDWLESANGSFFCDECDDHPELKGHPELMGDDKEYTVENPNYETPANYGPNDIGRRAPCDSYFSA